MKTFQCNLTFYLQPENCEEGNIVIHVAGNQRLKKPSERRTIIDTPVFAASSCDLSTCLDGGF